MPRRECLHDDVFDLPIQFFFVGTTSLQNVQDGSQRSFMATFFVPAFLFTLDVGVAEFIDRVIGQVHEVVVDVASGGLTVRLGAETG